MNFQCQILLDHPVQGRVRVRLPDRLLHHDQDGGKGEQGHVLLHRICPTVHHDRPQQHCFMDDGPEVVDLLEELEVGGNIATNV